MLILDFPTPWYSIGERVIFNPRNRRQYGSAELRYVGKVGVVMPDEVAANPDSDIPFVLFDKSTRKVAIDQEDLLPFVEYAKPKKYYASRTLDRDVLNDIDLVAR